MRTRGLHARAKRNRRSHARDACDLRSFDFFRSQPARVPRSRRSLLDSSFYTYLVINFTCEDSVVVS